MASKNGIIITVIILAGITGASFLAWLPEVWTGGISDGQNKATFVITDHERYLDDVKSIHEVLAESTEIEFEKMLDGEITPEQYIMRSETTSTQITMQISEFITSKPPERWQESYIMYGEALRSFNTYVAETQVVASLMNDGSLDYEDNDDSLNDLLEKIDVLQAESAEYAKRSDATRP